MILSLFRKKTPPEPVFAVYRAIVAQSRRPMLYADWGVPDTITGRFDMISLHMGLLFRRLRSADPKVRDFTQALFDLFFKDMDRSLREMGVGDLSVPKRVQKMGALFYGLLTAVGEPLDRRDIGALIEVIERNVYGGGAATEATLLANYLMAEADRLASQSPEAIMAGTLELGEAA